MASDFDSALDRTARELRIEKSVLTASLEKAIEAAAKKHFGTTRMFEAKYNAEKGTVELFQLLRVVDEVAEPAAEIALADARQRGLAARLGDELAFQIFYLDEDAALAERQNGLYGDLLHLRTFGRGFGRIAADVVRRVLRQSARDAERDRIYREYQRRKGQIVAGTVRRFERGKGPRMGKLVDHCVPVRGRMT